MDFFAMAAGGDVEGVASIEAIRSLPLHRRGEISHLRKHPAVCGNDGMADDSFTHGDAPDAIDGEEASASYSNQADGYL